MNRDNGMILVEVLDIQSEYDIDGILTVGGDYLLEDFAADIQDVFNTCNGLGDFDVVPVGRRNTDYEARFTEESDGSVSVRVTFRVFVNPNRLSQYIYEKIF
jgi:hypothetical protein